MISKNECDHEYTEWVYDPDRKEKVYEFDEFRGSDRFYESYHTGRYENVDRWSRRCKKCGHIEYNYDGKITQTITQKLKK